MPANKCQPNLSSYPPGNKWLFCFQETVHSKCQPLLRREANLRSAVLRMTTVTTVTSRCRKLNLLSLRLSDPRRTFLHSLFCVSGLRNHSTTTLSLSLPAGNQGVYKRLSKVMRKGSFGHICLSHGPSSFAWYFL